MPSFRFENRYQSMKRSALWSGPAEKYGGSLFLEDKGILFETKLMLTGIVKSFLDASIYPLIFLSLATKIAFRYYIDWISKKSGDKKEMFEWNKIRGEKTNAENKAICDDEQPIRELPEKAGKEMYGWETWLFADGGELLADPDGVWLNLLLGYFPNREQNGGTGRRETARKIRKGRMHWIILWRPYVNMCLKAMMWGRLISLAYRWAEVRQEYADRAICQIRVKNVEPLVIKVGGNYVRMVDGYPLALRTRPEKLCRTPSQRRSPTVFMKMEVLEQKLGRSFFHPIGDFCESAGGGPVRQQQHRIEKRWESVF